MGFDAWGILVLNYAIRFSPVTDQIMGLLTSSWHYDLANNSDGLDV
jgi:hypothetical protein